MTHVRRRRRGRVCLQVLLFAALQLGGLLHLRLATAQQELEFERLPAYARAPLALSQLAPTRRTGRIVIGLPDGEVLRLIPRPEAREVDGTASVRASAGGNRLLITTDGARAYGHVVADGRIYVIEMVAGKPAVIDADRLGGPQPGPGGWRNDAIVDTALTRKLLARAASAAIPESVAKASAAMSASAASVIDVAVFVEPALEARYGSQAVRTRAQAWVDFTNEAFRLNALPLSLRLVYLGPFDESLPLDTAGDLFGLFARNAAAMQLAQQYGADLRYLLYSQDLRPGLAYCGLGSLVGDVGISGFECGQHTFAHEIGHNFGAHHDRNHVPASEREPGGYNFGYTCGGRGTLMSYVGAGRIDHYSSPGLAFGGQPCGVAIGQPDAAFNAATIESHRTDVERFRPAQAAHGAVRFLESMLSVEERGAAAPFTLVRSGDLTREASVEVGLIDGTATEGEDVSPLLQRVVFAPGEGSRTLAVEPLDDAAHDAEVETLRAVLRFSRGLVVEGEPLEIQVTGSDDPDRGRATFSSARASVYERAGTLQIGVTRVGAASEPLTVSYVALDESAHAGVDYRLAPGQLTFAPGELYKSVAVEIIDDAQFQGYQAYRSFGVRLTGPNLGSARDFRVFVMNDDLRAGRAQFLSAATTAPAGSASATLTVRRVEGSEGDLHFDYATADGSGHAGQDYVARSGRITLANGTSSVTLDIPLLAGGARAERTFTVALSGTLLGTPASSTVTIAQAAPSNSTQGGAGTDGGGGSTAWAVLLALAAALAMRVIDARRRKQYQANVSRAERERDAVPAGT